MAILVFVESAEGAVKKTSLEAVAYASAMNSGDVTAVAMGSSVDTSSLEKLGAYGATKVMHANDERLNEDQIQAYASVLNQAMDQAGTDTLVLAKSSLGDPVAARVAIKQHAALASNVVALPETNGDGLVVKRSIYTGKAFAYTSLATDKKIIAIKKNAIELAESGGSATVEAFSPTLEDSDFTVNITSTEKSEGEVLLPEADVVVSGGRGMKGPENWGMIEDLADTLGAATGCSKPVSDMGWRPHHEHVGQTGIKVSPSLYVAIGISGAIQHLAGVNSSKNILVINQDEEAPFFKSADYGVVGDAFEIVPKLTEAIKAAKD